VLGSEFPVGFGRIPRQSKNFDFSRFVFFNVLLKLNKLANSLFCVVFGIKGEHDGPIIFKRIAELPEFAVLIGQCEIHSGMTGRVGSVLNIPSRAGKQN
jgi:hypothetical protein